MNKGLGGFRSQQPSYALALGCEISYAEAFVYADDLNLTERSSFEPIGISCRICERVNCASRAVPPLRRRIFVDPDRRETTPYRIG